MLAALKISPLTVARSTGWPAIISGPNPRAKIVMGSPGVPSAFWSLRAITSGHEPARNWVEVQVRAGEHLRQRAARDDERIDAAEVPLTKGS